MTQEDRPTEGHISKDHITVAEFTSKEWNNNASFSMLSFFGFSLAFGVMGLIVALILMIFLSDMRTLSAVALFSATFGIVFGSIFQKAEQSRGKTFLSDFSTKINVVLTELGGNELQNITPSKLKELIDSGTHHPLNVDGVAGLHLRVHENPIARTTSRPAPNALATATAEPRQVEKPRSSSKHWRVVITTEAPEYGTASFDRLLSAATPSGSTKE